MGPLIPLFWTSGDICPRFQSLGISLSCFLTCVILRFLYLKIHVYVNKNIDIICRYIVFPHQTKLSITCKMLKCQYCQRCVILQSTPYWGAKPRPIPICRSIKPQNFHIQDLRSVVYALKVENEVSNAKTKRFYCVLSFDPPK